MKKTYIYFIINVYYKKDSAVKDEHGVLLPIVQVNENTMVANITKVYTKYRNRRHITAANVEASIYTNLTNLVFDINVYMYKNDSNTFNMATYAFEKHGALVNTMREGTEQFSNDIVNELLDPKYLLFVYHTNLGQ